MDKIDIRGINVKEMFDTINKRISMLYDRDHMLGHSYFLPLLQDASFEKLKEIFVNDVLPLLEEYFFEDWERIVKVLGDGMKPKELRMIVPSLTEEEVSLLLDDEDDGIRNIQYRRNLDALDNPQSYIAIYQNI